MPSTQPLPSRPAELSIGLSLFHAASFISCDSVIQIKSGPAVCKDSGSSADFISI